MNNKIIEKDNSIYEYFPKNEIYKKDAIKFMQQLEKDKIFVDSIITDPPYNVSRKNNFNTMGRNSIDFGSWDKNFNQIKWIKYASRIIKEGGSILIFNDWKNMGKISNELQKYDFEVKDLIKWVKPNPMPRNVKRRYVIDTEYIIWAVKKGNKKWTFNFEPTHKKPYLRPTYKSSSTNGIKRFHPNQKPINLLKELIRIHTNVSDIIYDPFSGSGSISVAASEEKRNFIATEINNKFYEKSISRIEIKQIPRPIFNHLGNKYRIIDILLDKFKEQKKITRFVDVFSGSGIVSASIFKSDFPLLKEIIVNDKEETVFDLLKYINNNDKEILIKNFRRIINEYKLFSNKKVNKENYNNLKNSYNKIAKKIHKSEKDKNKMNKFIFILVLYGFNQQIRFNSRREFNIPAGKYINPLYVEQKIKSFKELIDDKKKLIFFEQKDFQDLINKILKEKDSLEDVLFYFDPPYLLAKETYNEIWTEKNELDLLELMDKITEKKGKWVYSNFIFSKNKENEILKEFIRKNKNIVFQKSIDKINYNNSNYQRKNLKGDKEILLWNWKNPKKK